MAKFFRTVFASTGDKATIPEPSQGDGSISFTDGFGFDYQRDQTSDPAALNIPRQQTNQLLFDITSALQVLQVHGFPDFITSADNDSAPFPYDANSVVRSGGVLYQSLIDANTDTPPTSNWLQLVFAAPFRPADVMATHDSTLPSGWLWLDGKTIGDASSNATSRANADTLNLFTVYWNSMPNTTAKIYNSDGTAGARGTSAAADFAAHKAISLIDRRGRAAFGADNLGGTAAGRLNNYRQGLNGTILGATGGEENHVQADDEVVVHSHHIATKDANTAGGSYQGVVSSAGNNSTGPAIDHFTDNDGGGVAFNIIPPAVIEYFRIKL